jgi:hypothetical protein
MAPMSILQRARSWLLDHGVSLSTQNLNEKPGAAGAERYGSMLANGRAWLRRLTADGEDYKPGAIRVEWVHGKRVGWGAEIAFDPEDREVTVAFGLLGAHYWISLTALPARLFELLPMNAHRPGRKYPHERRIGLRFHNGAAWFAFWEDEMEWRSKDPWWMRGRVGLDDVADIVFGKIAYSHQVLETRPVSIPMPEGVHDAIAKRTLSRWVRPRFPWYPVSRESYGVQIDIPKGIGHPGKGEDAHNVGDDAVFGISTDASNVEEAIGKLVASVLRSRMRYGGSHTFTPSAPPPSSTPSDSGSGSGPVTVPASPA